MPLAVLQEKLKSFPEEYFDEINSFFDLLYCKVNAQSAQSAQKKQAVIIPCLAEGKWKYPKNINAFDDEICDMFEDYV